MLGVRSTPDILLYVSCVPDTAVLQNLTLQNYALQVCRRCPADRGLPNVLFAEMVQLFDALVVC
jgi:hypothetical protein